MSDLTVRLRGLDLRSRVEARENASPYAHAVLGLAALTVWIFIFAYSTPVLEHASQARLYAQFREELALGTAPLGGAIKQGAPVAIISSSALHLERAVVVEGTSARALRNGPGHLATSALPGQAGWSVLMGRSVLYGAPFRHIRTAAKGAVISVVTGEGSYQFTVTDVRRPGDPLPASPTSGAGLTLVSSVPKGFLGAGSIVYLDAALSKGSAALAPYGRPNTIYTTDAAMRGDSSALVPLVLWLELLVGLVAGLIYVLRHWNLWQAWLAAVPIGLAALVGATSAALALLPNLL